MSEHIVEMTEALFDEEVLASDLPVLVDFWAVWCGPCRMIAPHVEKLAVEYDGKCKVVKVNIDEQPNLAVRYQVMSIPTVMLFDQGQPIDKIVGANPGALATLLENNIKA